MYYIGLVIYAGPLVASCGVIAERLSARLLIVQRSQLAFVCMYIYIYIYPSHFDYVGVVSVVSSPYYCVGAVSVVSSRLLATRRRSTCKSS